MRVLMFTQGLDESDWLIGFIPPWVNALARQVEALDVVALRVKQYTPPANVRVFSMGRERGRLGALVGFYQAALPLIRQCDVIFVHMIPRFAVLAAPLAKLYRKPMTLWYTHRQINRELRWALAACQHVTTAAPDTFRIPTPKLHVLGHGIDNQLFAPGDVNTPDNAMPAVVHVGRLMPIKYQATLLRAIASGVPAETVLIGDVPKGHDTSYAESLKVLAGELGIADRVRFTGGLPAHEVRDWYRRAAVAVNLTPAGSFDKAVLEGLMVGIPTIVSHGGFDSLLGEYAARLRIESPEDAAGLAQRLRELLALAPDERAAMTRTIRERTVAAHSLDQLMVRLVQVMDSRS